MSPVRGIGQIDHRHPTLAVRITVDDLRMVLQFAIDLHNVPLTGVYKVDVVLVDSISPICCPALTVAPAFGKSMKTISPRASCAKSTDTHSGLSPLDSYPFMLFDDSGGPLES